MSNSDIVPIVFIWFVTGGFAGIISHALRRDGLTVASVVVACLFIAAWMIPTVSTYLVVRILDSMEAKREARKRLWAARLKNELEIEARKNEEAQLRHQLSLDRLKLDHQRVQTELKAVIEGEVVR